MSARRSMGASWGPLAGLVLLAGPSLLAGSAPQDGAQTRPSLTSGRPPEYDLAIVKIGSAIRWQGGLAEPATLDVSIVSLGLRDVRQPDVECTMDGKTLRTPGGGSIMRRSEPYQIQVQISGRETVEIKPGRHLVTCAARIVQPRDARDGNPANDTFTDTVTLDAPPRPDLAIQSIELRDCETRGSAVAGRAMCAEVTFATDRRGAGIAAPWSTVCEIDGVRTTVPGVAPIDRGSVAASRVPLEQLTAGEHVADCAVDGKNEIDEADETNNRRTDKVLVLADSSDIRYDLAIKDIGPSVGESRDEATRQPSVFIEVRLQNLGTQPVLEADVRCELGATGLAFLSLGAVGLQPGEEAPLRVQIWGRRLAQVPSGTHETTCITGIVLPKGVVESDVENNVRTGKVVRR